MSDHDFTDKTNDLHDIVLKKENKKKKKKEKKEKKSKKDFKDKPLRHDSSEDEEEKVENECNSTADLSQRSNNKILIEKISINKSKITDDDPKTFFAKLTHQEMNKPKIGSIHSIGKKRDISKMSTVVSSGDWECVKCSTTNFKNCIQCQKCKSMKKMTEWR